MSLKLKREIGTGTVNMRVIGFYRWLLKTWDSMTSSRKRVLERRLRIDHTFQRKEE